MLARLPWQSSLQSSAKTDESHELKDVRKRNRLSKPPISRISSQHLSALSLLENGDPKSAVHPLSPHPGDSQQDGVEDISIESRETPTASPIVSDSHYPSSSEAGWKSCGESAARSLHTETPTSATPIRNSHGSILPTLLNRSRLSIVSSKEPKDAKERTSPLCESPVAAASRDILTSPIPIRRKSLHQHGIATRIARDESQTTSLPATPLENEVRRRSDDVACREIASSHKSDVRESDARKSDAVPLLQPMSPPPTRSETPSDLSFLGGLKLGSLHVTNGRASPAPSDLSKRAKVRSAPNLRAVSSESANTSCDKTNPPILTPPQDAHSQAPMAPRLPQPSILPSTPILQSRFYCGNPLTKLHTLGSYVDQKLPLKEQTPHEKEHTCSSPRHAVSVQSSPTRPSPGQCPTEWRHAFSERAVDPTTKLDDLDNGFSEDDSGTPSDSDCADNSTSHTSGSSNDAVAVRHKYQCWPSSSRPVSTATVSVRSSIVSSRAVGESAEADRYTFPTEPTPPINGPNDNAGVENVSQGVSKSRDGRWPGLRTHSFRSSFLRPAAAARSKSTPVFQNFHHSSTTVSTLMTTASSPSTRKPKRLSKLRLLSQTSLPQEIVVTGKHDLHDASIPPVSAECYRNLAIRTQQMPELDHTVEGREHTDGDDTFSAIDPVQIRFPSPTPSTDELGHRFSSPRRPPRRTESSFPRWSKSDRRRSTPTNLHDASEADILAVVQEFGGLAHVLGSNPYDVARPNPRSSMERRQSTSRLNPHNITSAASFSTPTNGMDAETAAELARIRSRVIHRGDSPPFAGKRRSLNHGAGLPGKHLRTTSLYAGAPPLPPIPPHMATHQTTSWASRTGVSYLPQRRSWQPDDDSPREQRGHRQSWGSDVVEIGYDLRQDSELDVNRASPTSNRATTVNQF